mgnify:CR=1 FL=1
MQAALYLGYWNVVLGVRICLRRVSNIDALCTHLPSEDSVSACV